MTEFSTTATESLHQYVSDRTPPRYSDFRCPAWNFNFSRSLRIRRDSPIINVVVHMERGEVRVDLHRKQTETRFAWQACRGVKAQKQQQDALLASELLVLATVIVMF